MPLSDEFLAKWDYIISEVDKTQVPLRCINKMIIKIDGGKQKTINLARLRRDGLDDDEVEEPIKIIEPQKPKKKKTVILEPESNSEEEIIIKKNKKKG